MPRGGRFALLVVTAAALQLFSATAACGMPIDLGSAGPSNYAVLVMGGPGHGNLTDNDGGVTGNIGIGPKIGGLSGPFYWTWDTVLNGDVYLGGTPYFNNAGTINGTVYAADSSVVPVPGGGTISGGVVVDPAVNSIVDQAVADAQAAAAFYRGLSCTICGITTLFNPGADVELTGVDGTNVVDLSYLWLTGSTLTLNAVGANAQFVLNVSDGFVLDNGNIRLAGDLTPDEVLINFTGDSPLATIGSSNDISAIILAEQANVYFSRTHVTGEIISGGSLVQLTSRTFVDAASRSISDVPAETVPEPGSLILIGTGGLLVSRKLGRAKSKQSHF